ncbi:hypothetical protein GYMLUDRAFT_40351 [Collybiopsis luxurians FD-317 M1]|uniref:Uncharacterized protein n=1 Tax=Collybiopsis luxurians FD-317 M1 TaxID=944289 RepID=A0A0D0D453_9AGAR|nr:hypothetical protein GYMLUDRAFT_40351 [Collybiopsis luxurians FD-317 M1]
MGWLTSPDPRSTERTLDGAVYSRPSTASYDEPKSLGHVRGSSSIAHAGSPWSVEPVRHPFQLTATTSDPYSTPPPSITSNTPLHPSSHLDMLPTPTTTGAPMQIPAPTHTESGPERRPSTRMMMIPSRLSHRASPVHSWIVRHRFISLLISIPFPVMLSVIYLIVGHTILRAAGHSAYEFPTLSSSAEAGAVGGAVLTLPIISLLFAIQQMSIGLSNPHSGPDDFFDDESDAGTEVLWRGLLAYILVVIIAVFVGTIAGPIGVSILKSSSSGPLLSASQGAIAGVVGGSIFLPVIIGLCVIL